jgi:hypothetical protein
LFHVEQSEPTVDVVVETEAAIEAEILPPAAPEVTREPVNDPAPDPTAQRPYPLPDKRAWMNMGPAMRKAWVTKNWPDVDSDDVVAERLAELE